jgi:hypothetical protein
MKQASHKSLKPALLVVALLVALLLALWIVPRQAARRSETSGVAALQEKIAALQAELAEERLARRILGSEVDLMRDVLLEFSEEMDLGQWDAEGFESAGLSPRSGEDEEEVASQAPGGAGDDPDAGQRSAAERRSKEPVFNLDGLIAAGVHELEAERVREVWQRIELEKLELRDLAVRERWLNSKRFKRELKRIKRDAVDELGECGYDSMLYGTGKNNRVVVRDVLAGSAAERAGIEAGDIVLRYNDRRVWAASDLQAATSRGVRGETLTIDVRRDGQDRYFRVERGPLGLFMRQERLSPDGC